MKTRKQITQAELDKLQIPIPLYYGIDDETYEIRFDFDSIREDFDSYIQKLESINGYELIQEEAEAQKELNKMFNSVMERMETQEELQNKLKINRI